MKRPERKPWSLSTTVRNPERLLEFLRVLHQFEGEPFGTKTQIDYQIALIQARLYRPQHIPEALREEYENYREEMSWETARSIFEFQNYKDPPMRGRQSLNPLKKLGFVRIEPNEKTVRLTPAGKQILENPELFREAFFRAMLKLQFPNPLNRDFSATAGFNIRPFIAVLHLLQQIREHLGSGITHEEFCIFVPTLIHADHITSHLEAIRLFRSIEGKSQFILNFLIKFYSIQSITYGSTKYKNLFDYGDNTLRAFRLTGFLFVRSDPIRGEFTIQLEPTRQAQAEQLLESFPAYSETFESTEAYLDHIGNPELPNLPWEEQQKQYQVVQQLIHLIEGDANLRQRISPELLRTPIPDSDVSTLQEIEAELRRAIRESIRTISKDDLRHNWEKLHESILVLEDRKKANQLEPEDLEKLAHDIFLILNDELIVQPNYPTDEFGNPLTHAPGNRADVEIVYQGFHLLLEVTLDSSRLQWVRETQPVMRHLRDYEERHPEAEVYCLFLAPKVHEDTYSQFWIAIRYEYDGARRKIIPLTFQQFARILETIRLREGQFEHTVLRGLLERLLRDLEALSGYQDWSREIAHRIESWIEEQDRAD